MIWWSFSLGVKVCLLEYTLSNWGHCLAAVLRVCGAVGWCWNGFRYGAKVWPEHSGTRHSLLPTEPKQAWAFQSLWHFDNVGVWAPLLCTVTKKGWQNYEIGLAHTRMDITNHWGHDTQYNNYCICMLNLSTFLQNCFWWNIYERYDPPLRSIKKVYRYILMILGPIILVYNSHLVHISPHIINPMVRALNWMSEACSSHPVEFQSWSSCPSMWNLLWFLCHDQYANERAPCYPSSGTWW